MQRDQPLVFIEGNRDDTFGAALWAQNLDDRANMLDRASIRRDRVGCLLQENGSLRVRGI
jgi:hypothetical protein